MEQRRGGTTVEFYSLQSCLWKIVKIYLFFYLEKLGHNQVVITYFSLSSPSTMLLIEIVQIMIRTLN